MKLLYFLSLLLIVFFLGSCVSSRPMQYVQGQFDTARLSQYVIKEPVIRNADLVNIVVFSDNPAATAIYNQPNATGYLVDQNGNIQFQGIGNLHVEGLTKNEVIVLLDSKLKVFLQNPFYSIRFANFKVTLIGEVMKEGVYTIPNERVNIFEAVGLAGGLSVYAKRENVMVIREVNGKREFARLDLTNPEVFKSPFYYLQQNDMVVVEQTKNKMQNFDQTVFRNISLASTVISTLLFIYSIFRQ